VSVISSCYEPKSPNISPAVLIAVNANKTLTWFHHVRPNFTFSFCSRQSCYNFVSFTEQGQSLDVVFTPGLNTKCSNVSWHLCCGINLNRSLDIRLSGTKQRSLGSIHESKSDRVDSHADAGFDLSDCFSCEVGITEQTFALAGNDSWEFKVTSIYGSID